MKRQLLATALSVAVCALLLACDRPATDAAETPAPPVAMTPDADTPATPSGSAAVTDLEQLAQRLVTQSAAVKEGDIVLITGRPHDAELLENLAVNVRMAGGFPLVEYSSDRLSKRLFFDVPAQYDAQTDALGTRMAEVLDVVINVGNATTENLLEGADPARMAARGKAGESIGQAFFKNNVRTIEVGNNLYPTPWRAERFGMDEGALAQTFWNGVNLDYSELQTRGEQVKAALAGGNEVHITNPNGTDLKLRVQGRPVLVSDGIISADDLRRGGAAVSVYLPAGEVYTTPVAGTAEGKVVQSQSFHRGKQVDDLTLTFVGGKVTAMTGSGPGYAGLKAEYDAVDDTRKHEFAFVDLGINPKVTLPAASKVGNWVPAGSVTVGIGSNTWAGGDNSVPYTMTAFLPGSTVMLDGKPIVEKGTLKL
ncbi:MAG: aminopeptidase [Pseudomonadota bacterium]|nr:aminopeptidase [Pseudomonadota bacterium]